MDFWQKIGSPKQILKRGAPYLVVLVFLFAILFGISTLLWQKRVAQTQAAPSVCEGVDWSSKPSSIPQQVLWGKVYVKGSITHSSPADIIFSNDEAHLIVQNGLTISNGVTFWAGNTYDHESGGVAYTGSRVQITVCGGDFILNGKIRTDGVNDSYDIGARGRDGDPSAEATFGVDHDIATGGGGGGGNGGAGGGGGGAIIRIIPGGEVDARSRGGGGGPALFGYPGQNGGLEYSDGGGGKYYTPDHYASAYALALAVAKNDGDIIEFLKGGSGQADENHLVGGRGGNASGSDGGGGGFVYVDVKNGDFRFDSANPNSAIDVSGKDGHPLPGNPASPSCQSYHVGGGGAGGAVYIKANTVFDPSINASGGKGAPSRDEGPVWTECYWSAGGGGGGGIIYIHSKLAGGRLIMDRTGGTGGSDAGLPYNTRSGINGADGLLIEPLELRLGAVAGIQITKETRAESYTGAKTSTFNSGEDVYVSLVISGSDSLNGYSVEDEVPAGYSGFTQDTTGTTCGISSGPTAGPDKISWTLNESATSCTIQYKFKMP